MAVVRHEPGRVIVECDSAVAGMGAHGAPSIARTEDNLQTLGALKTLWKAGHKGKFVCGEQLPDGTVCGKDLTDRLETLPNDTRTYTLPCPKCRRVHLVNVADLFTKALQANQRQLALPIGGTP